LETGETELSDPSHDDPLAPNAFTVLRLIGIGVQPYSARGLKQTLTHLDQAANMKRTVNGDLKDISFENFRKYKSTITGDDQTPPNFDKVWPGMPVTVDCVSQLSYSTTGGTPGRAVVPGSDRAEGAHTYYRPRLDMLVTAWNIDEDEYGVQISWSLDLEEA
jgi:hypothetical protein